MSLTQKTDQNDFDVIFLFGSPSSKIFFGSFVGVSTINKSFKEKCFIIVLLTRGLLWINFLIRQLIVINIAPLTELFCNCPLFCNCSVADLQLSAVKRY